MAECMQNIFQLTTCNDPDFHHNTVATQTSQSVRKQRKKVRIPEENANAVV